MSLVAETQLVGTETAAKALGVHPVTLQRWAKDGRVKPAYRTPGGVFRWDMPDLRRQLGMPAEETIPDERRT